MQKQKQDALGAIDALSPQLKALADDIWEHPECSLKERHAAARYAEALEQLGFQVEQELGGIETAFCGSFGSGSPVIGILGEFDALSGLSQAAGETAPRPLQPGGNGHGCGHNLLGVGALAAACAVKRYLETSGASGTVIFFGCPGEEGGSGKAFLARVPARGAPRIMPAEGAKVRVGPGRSSARPGSWPPAPLTASPLVPASSRAVLVLWPGAFRKTGGWGRAGC